MRTDGWIDTKLIVAFSNFAYAPKNVLCWSVDWIPQELFRVEM